MHNVNINITKKEHVYIDGQTGEELTKEQFLQKHGGIKATLRANLGAGRVKISNEAKVERDEENEKI